MSFPSPSLAIGTAGRIRLECVKLFEVESMQAIRLAVKARQRPLAELPSKV